VLRSALALLAGPAVAPTATTPLAALSTANPTGGLTRPAVARACSGAWAELRASLVDRGLLVETSRAAFFRTLFPLLALSVPLVGVI